MGHSGENSIPQVLVPGKIIIEVIIMTKLGIMLRSYLPVRASIELAQEAERRGFHSVWVTEGMDAKDAFTQMTALAISTQSIKIGSGIVPIYTRTPVLTAMSTMALAEISNERAILGLGASHPWIIEGGHGLKLDRPLSRMREYVEIVRGVLQEREFTYKGNFYDIPRYISYSRHHFENQPFKVPIFLAALRLGMARLAGTLADGVLLNLATADYLARAAKVVRQEAHKAHRDPTEVTIASLVGVAVSQDEAAAAEAVRLEAARYPTLQPFYRSMLREAGFAKEMDAIGPDVETGDVDSAVKKIPDTMVNALGAFGPPQRARERFRPFQETGADLLVIMPYIPQGVEPIQAIADIIEAFGPHQLGKG